MAPTRGPSSFLPYCRNERAARDCVPLPPAAAQHEIHEVGAPQLGRQADLLGGAAAPAQRFEQHTGGARHLRRGIGGVGAAARHGFERLVIGQTSRRLSFLSQMPWETQARMR